ncbi:MAG: Gfo/Idh/MocA family oxidoreductase [Chloroflexota bacterium]|nr:Gfo/Idh/MocA family oxidoreductase [Chloroflexota bacterium]
MDGAGGTLKVGIVGAGGIARQHGIAWTANAPRGEIVAVADVSELRAKALAGEFGVEGARVYDGIGPLLADPEVAAVDVCLPHHLHTEAIVAAARAGKAILCEKPLCTSLADAATIGATLRETGVTFVMAHNQLFQPSLIEARRVLGTGALGRPFLFRSIEAFQNTGAITGQGGASLPPGESPWAWRSDPARMGGGEVLDTGWHGSYRLLALADSPPVEVTALTDRFMLPGEGSEDTGVLLVRFASGAVGEMLTTWAFMPVGGWQFEVMAEHGSLAGGGGRIAHSLHRWPAPAEQTFPAVHTFTAEVTHFLDVVQRGEPSLATFEHGARVLQLTMAAYRSAAEKRAVALPEDPLAEV